MSHNAADFANAFASLKDDMLFGVATSSYQIEGSAFTIVAPLIGMILQKLKGLLPAVMMVLWLVIIITFMRVTLISLRMLALMPIGSPFPGHVFCQRRIIR